MTKKEKRTQTLACIWYLAMIGRREIYHETENPNRKAYNAIMELAESILHEEDCNTGLLTIASIGKSLEDALKELNAWETEDK